MADSYGVGVEEFVDWPTYQSSRSDVDPADAYSDYLNVVMPNYARVMGATPEQVKETQTLFQNQIPRPTPKPKDEGVIKNAAGAIGHELGSLGRTARAGIAVVGNDPLKLAKIAQEEQETQKEVNAPQARFREGIDREGSLWEFLSSSAKSAVQEPQGAFDSTLQVLTGFLPFMAAGVAGAVLPGVGKIVGTAAAMGLTAADLEAGSKGIMLLQRAAVADGIDLNDEPAVKKWIEGGGAEKVFGPSIKAALTGGAVTALTMGVVGVLGNKVSSLLSQSGLVGDAQRTALAAGREGTRAGTATADSLRRAAIGTQVGELGTVVGGFGAASALGNIAAGEPVDEKDMFVSSLTLLLPAGAGAAMKFRGGKTPKFVEQITGGEASKAQVKADEEVLRKAILEGGEEVPTLRDVVEPVLPKIKLSGEETEVPVMTGDVKPPPPPPGPPPSERVTKEQIEAIKPFDEVPVETTAVATVKTNEILAERYGGPTPEGERVDTLLKNSDYDIVVERNPDGSYNIGGIFPGDYDYKEIKDGASVHELNNLVGNTLAAKIIKQKEGEVVYEQKVEKSIEDKAVAVSVVQDVAKDALNEHVTKTAEEVKSEVQKRRAKRAAALKQTNPFKREALAVVAPDTATSPVSPEGRATPELRSAEDAALQQRIVSEVTAGPLDRGNTGVVEEGVYTGTEGKSGSNQSSGRTSRSSETITGEQVVSGINAGGEKSGAEIIDLPSTKAWNKAVRQEFEIALQEARQLMHHGRIMPEELQQAVRGKDQYEVARNLEMLLRNKRERAANDFEIIQPFRTKEEAVRAKNPLYAGKEATEAANRKAEQDVQDALRSESEGDYLPTWSIDTSAPGGVRLRAGFPQAVETVLRAGRVSGEQMLHWFANRSDVPEYRALAKAMLPEAGTGIKIRLGDNLKNKKGEPVRGYADSATREVALDRKSGIDQETLFHELTHILTVNGVMNPKTLSQRVAAAEMNKLYVEAKEKSRPEQFKYSLKTVREFIAEAHANPKFQDHLVTLRDKFGKNFWEKFKEIWNKFWGKPLPENMLEQVLRVSKDLYGEGKAESKDFAVEDRQNLIAYKAMQKDGPGDVVGRKDGVVAWRGWDNKDGTYRMYEVIPGGDPRGEAPKQIVDAENLKAFLEDKGVDVELRNLKGFDQPPGNKQDLVTRWLEGKLAYAATQTPDGTWRAMIGEDLNSPSAERGFRDFKTREEAEAAANVVSTHDTKQKSEFEKLSKETTDLISAKGGEGTQLVVGDPNWVASALMDRNSPINYVAGRTDNWLKKLGINVPEGMKLSVEFMMKTSDIGKRTEKMMKENFIPLIEKTRKLMATSPLLEGSKGAERLQNIVRFSVVEERANRLLPKYTEETKWVDPNDHSQGYTEFYNKAVKNQQRAQDYLAKITAQDPTLVSQVQRLMREDWKPFTDSIIDLEHASGRISKATADAKKAAYTMYAPLRETGRVTGKTATGQSIGGKDLFAQIGDQAASAIIFDVDNQAMRLLDRWTSVIDYRNEDGTKIFKKTLVDLEHLKHDPKTGEITVTSVLNPNKSVVWYENGVPMRMEVHNTALLKALDRFHGEERHVVIQKMLGAAGFYTRAYSTLHTSLSMPFAPKNFVRDLWTNLTQLNTRIPYLTFAKKMVSPAVWEASFRQGFKEAISLTGADALKGNSEGAKLARRVEEDRPLIEHKYQYGADLIAQAPSTALKPTILSRLDTYFAPSNGKVMNYLSGLTHSLEAVNRIAVYEAAIESGIGRREAAVMAKLSTTNFEQRGMLAPWLNPNYVFHGAKMSGARTFLENVGASKIQGPQAGGLKKAAVGLVGGSIPESANPRTVHAVQLMVGLGLAGAYMAYKTSEKDKDGRTKYGKRSEFQLDNYFNVPGLNIDLPIPQEIGLAYSLGSSMGDALWGDRAGSASSPAVRYAAAVIQNFNPGGSSMHDPVGPKTGDYFARLVVPTWATPGYDIGIVNSTTFGGPVNRQRGSETIPPEMQGAASSSPFARMAAQGLHKGGFDTSPKAVDHVIKSIFGSQKGAYNAILDGNVGALLNEFTKSFHQEVFPGTDKLDYEASSIEAKHNATREAGKPLKNKQFTGSAKIFVDTDNKLKKLRDEYNKTTDPDKQKQIDEKQNDLRLNTLKKYYEQTGVTK